MGMMPIRLCGGKRMLLAGAVCFVWLILGLAVGTYEAKADGVENGFVYTVSEGEATITNYTGVLTKMSIPDTVGGYPVTRIGNVAFRGKDLEEIEIPASVETIGTNAFYLNRLTKVTLHEGLKTIGTYAFSGIYSDETVGNALTEIEIPSTVEMIDARAFYNNALKKVTLHEGLKSIGAFAFQKNAIEEIEIPASVETVGFEAFYQNRLTKVTLHEGLKTIEQYAFTGIYSDDTDGNALTEIEIPSTVEMIGTGAFYHNALTKVTLHEGLKSIGTNAFYNNDLTFIVIPQSVDTIMNLAFRDNPSEFTVIGWIGTEADNFAARADIPFRDITTLLDHLQFDPNGQEWAQEAKTTVTGEPYGIFELQYAWSLDEAAPAPGAGWVSFENGDELEQLTEGEWFLHIYGTGYGTDKRVTSNKFGVDRTLPTLDVTMTTGTPAGLYANDTWSAETVEVRANASDAFGEVDFITVKIGDEAPIVVPGNTYSASFETDGIYQLTITATDKAGNESAPVQRVVKIGKSEPTLTVTATKEDTTNYVSGTWTNQPVTVAATAEAGTAPISAMLYSTDGGGVWHNHTHPIELAAEDSNDILFKAVDEAGNETAASIQVRIDKTAPQIDTVMERSPSAEPYVNDTWSAETVEVHMDATDARSGIHGLTIQVNDDPPINVSGSSWVLPFETDGIYQLTITATDTAGNESAPVQWVVKIGKSKPTLTVTATKEDTTNYVNGTWANQSVTVAATAAAGTAPILAQEYSLDGGGIWHAYSIPLLLSLEGSNHVWFKARDEAGNETTASIQVQIDRIAPYIHTVMERTPSAEPYVNNTWSAETVAVNMDVSDSGSGVHGLTIQVNDDPPISVSGSSRTLPFETDGIYQLTITATDTAGNESAPVQRIVKIAKSGPALTVTATKEDTTNYVSGTWTNQSVTFAATAVDGAAPISAVEYSLDGGGIWDTYMNPIELTAEGSYPISFKVTDEANNEKTASLQVQIDQTAPQIHTVMERSLSAEPYVNDTWSAETVRVNIDAADAGSGIHGLTIKVNDSLPMNVTGATYAMLLETDGVYRLTISARDMAGNESAPVQRIVKISKSEPALAVTATKEDSTAYTSGTWTNQSVTVAATAVGGTSELSVTTAVYYSLDSGGTWHTYVNPIELTAEGSHPISFKVTDEANNEKTASLLVQIDKTVPHLQTLMEGSPSAEPYVNDTWSAETVRININAADMGSGVHGLTIKVNDSLPLNVTGATYAMSFETDGVYRLTITATDTAGNESAAVQRVVKISKSELTLTLTATKEDGAAYISGTWTNRPVTVAAAASASGGGSDTSVTTAVYYSLDGGVSWAPYTIPVRLTEAGSHTLAFYALDAADRRFTDQLNIHIDTTAPEIQFVPDGNEVQTIGNAVAAAVHVTDPCGGSACSGIANSFPVYVWSKLHTLVDSGNQADWAGFANGETLIQSGEVGTWYLHVRAVDRAGNSAAAVSKPFHLNKPNDGGGNPGGNPGEDPDGNNGGNPDENNDDHSGESDTPGQPATPEQPAIPEQPGTQEEPACLGQEPFTDIAGHWGETSIIKAYCKHMIDGYPDGSFKPDRVVTRAEFTMMLYRLFQWESGKTVLSFSDLSRNEHWAKQAIVQAAAAGVVSGYPDGSFRPEGAISRAEMAIMIAKALGLPADVYTTTAFNDDADIPAWAKNAVESIRRQGIVIGRGDNSFVSSGAVTRAEAAVILLRAEEHKR